MTDFDETFDIFSESGEPLGQAPRSQVHREGLWHRSVHVFLFDAGDRLILQQRAADKDVCAGLWDQSAAEHLKPGESYLDGARRGLAEELGISGVVLTPLGGPHAARLDQPEFGIRDYEFQQSFRGRHDGPLSPDPAEVAAIRTMTLIELSDALAAQPDAFTPWLRRDLVRCGIIRPF